MQSNSSHATASGGGWTTKTTLNQINERAPRRNASNYVIGRLEHIIGRKRPSRLTGPDGDWIWLDPGAGLHRCAISRPAEFFRLDPDALEMRACASAPDGPESTRPLPELLWIAAYHAADGGLMQGCGPHDVIELRQWPNLTRLPHTREMIMLASMLFKRPASLSFAYRVLRISQSDAFTFYSAARAAGLIHTVSSLPATSSEPPAELPESSGKRLWHRLFQRLTRL